MQDKDKKTENEKQPTKSIPKAKDTDMRKLGYTYGVLLRVMNKELNAVEAVEMIRAVFVEPVAAKAG